MHKFHKLLLSNKRFYTQYKKLTIILNQFNKQKKANKVINFQLIY